MSGVTEQIESRVADQIPLGAATRYKIVRDATLGDGRNPLEGLAEMMVALWLNDRPLEALEASVELEEFLKDFRQDLVDQLRRENPPSSWTSIASALGVSKQAARERYASSEEARCGLPRPGPASGGRRTFLFEVNKSFLAGSSPITIPTAMNEWAADRLLEDRKGASRMIMIEGPDEATRPGRLRFSETGGHGYYQLNAPRGALGLRFGERVEVTLHAELPEVRARLRRLHPPSA